MQVNSNLKKRSTLKRKIKNLDRILGSFRVS